MTEVKFDVILGTEREEDTGGVIPPGTYIEVTNNANNVTGGVNPNDVVIVQQLDDAIANLPTVVRPRGTFEVILGATAEYPKAIATNAVNALQIGNGSGTGPNIEAGDAWRVLDTGLVGSGIEVDQGDFIIANVDNAGNNDADWYIQEGNSPVTKITIADALNLIAFNRVIVGQAYEITDRRGIVLRGTTTASFSGYGSMVVLANEYENTVEENILVEYDLTLDLIYKITDVRRNVYDTFFNFSSLASFLTSVRYGNTGVTGNAMAEQFNISAGSGPFFIMNNNNEGYVGINATVGTTFSDNYSDRSSTVVCDTGTIAGTRAMQSSQALAIGGTIDSTVDMSSIIAVSGSGYSLLDKVSSGSSININNGGSSGSTVSDSSVVNLRDAFAIVAIIRSGASYEAFGTNTLRNAEILGQTVFITSSNSDHTNIFARGSCYIECKTASTIYSDNTLYNATTILDDNSTLINSTISNGTVSLYGAGVGSYLTSNYVGNIDILSDGVLNDCLIENCAFPGSIAIGAGGVEIHNNRRAVPGFSNFKTTIDLDSFAGGNVDLAGIFLYGDIICTSANPTYTINSFANFNTNHGVRFRPAPGLTLTCVHGTGGGQPRNEGGLPAILNGANGDYIEYTYNPDYLEVFQTGGFNY